MDATKFAKITDMFAAGAAVASTCRLTVNLPNTAATGGI